MKEPCDGLRSKAAVLLVFSDNIARCNLASVIYLSFTVSHHLIIIAYGQIVSASALYCHWPKYPTIRYIYPPKTFVVQSSQNPLLEEHLVHCGCQTIVSPEKHASRETYKMRSTSNKTTGKRYKDIKWFRIHNILKHKQRHAVTQADEIIWKRNMEHKPHRYTNRRHTSAS